MTGHALPQRSSRPRSSEANPRLPSMNSAGSSGRFTPARLKTKSAPVHHASRSSGEESRSHSQTSSGSSGA